MHMHTIQCCNTKGYWGLLHGMLAVVHDSAIGVITLYACIGTVFECFNAQRNPALQAVHTYTYMHCILDGWG